MVLYETSSGKWSCELDGSSSLDSDGIDDWAINRSVHALTSSLVFTGVFANNARCQIGIYGRLAHSSAPYLTGLEVTSTSTSGHSYDTGETIESTATFSSPVTGTLTLPVTIGSDTVNFVATNHDSSSSTFVFRHIVAAGESDDDGITFGESVLYGYVDADLGHRLDHRVHGPVQPARRRDRNPGVRVLGGRH